jgi:hypothetical protein
MTTAIMNDVTDVSRHDMSWHVNWCIIESNAHFCPLKSSTPSHGTNGSAIYQWTLLTNYAIWNSCSGTRTCCL